MCLHVVQREAILGNDSQASVGSKANLSSCTKLSCGYRSPNSTYRILCADAFEGPSADACAKKHGSRLTQRMVSKDCGHKMNLDASSMTSFVEFSNYAATCAEARPICGISSWRLARLLGSWRPGGQRMYSEGMRQTGRVRCQAIPRALLIGDVRLLHRTAGSMSRRNAAVEVASQQANIALHCATQVNEL